MTGSYKKCQREKETVVLRQPTAPNKKLGGNKNEKIVRTAPGSGLLFCFDRFYCINNKYNHNDPAQQKALTKLN